MEDITEDVGEEGEGDDDEVVERVVVEVLESSLPLPSTGPR